jgi:hypothetical protein
MNIEAFLDGLKQVRKSGNGWTAQCPSHSDKHNSLSVGEGDDGRILIRCHAGCSLKQVTLALGLNMQDLFPETINSNGKNRQIARYVVTPRETTATLQPSSLGGCTLIEYAEAKRLPIEFLRECSLKDVTYTGKPIVRIPYFDENGIEGAIRFRVALHKTEDGDQRFMWRRGSKLMLYGLDRINFARQAGYVVLAEGESDCHTLWFHKIPALGLPGANNWNEQRDASFLDGIATIYIIDEGDKGGQAIRKWLSVSRIRDRARLMHLDNVKDPSDLYCADPVAFLVNWGKALNNSTRWADVKRVEAETEKEEAWSKCAELANNPRILDYFTETLKSCGVAGETRTAKVIYLSATSRLLDRPVSLAIKGPSSGGKSFVTEKTLHFFPESAYYALSAMSERALAYSVEPLSHRMLVVYEAAGIHGEFVTYLLRSLLSEGCVRYETVEKTREGLKPRLIQREGPTGLIVTTTSVNLHPENETRLLSLTVADTPEQTRIILMALADESVKQPSLDSWHALQTWLEQAEHRVSIPFAGALAEKIPPIATRLRRDFGAFLNLVRSHAMLHQTQRERDEQGRIIASIEDYRIVRELVADLMSECLDVTVSPTLRETVNTVRILTDSNEESPTNCRSVARELKIDKSSALRRVRVAIEKGYVRNLEDRRGYEARLVCGEPLPDDLTILPHPEDLQACMVAARLNGNAIAQSEISQQDSNEGCTVAPDLGGISPSSSLAYVQDGNDLTSNEREVLII